MLTRNLLSETVTKNIDSAIKRFSSTLGSSGRFEIDIEYKDVNRDKYREILVQNPEKYKRNGEAYFWEKVNKILKFYEYQKYTNGSAPSDISISEMEDLLWMNKEKEWRNYLHYLLVTESRRIRDRIKKTAKIKALEEHKQNREERTFGVFDANNEICYGLWKNTLFPRMGQRAISKQRTEKRLRYAALHGQPLILDLDYDDYMTVSEARIQVRHIVQTVQENLQSFEPFDIHFTNCQPTKTTVKTILEKYMHTTPFQQMDYVRHFLRGNYTDYFPRERLVYMSPHAEQSLNVIDPNHIYIVGAYLDKSALNNPASSIKAQREGIQQYRLPLDENIIWGSGSSKNLCIMHVVKVLNEIRYNPDWREVLHKHVPKRKVKSQDTVLREEEARRIAVMKRKLSIQKPHFYE